MMHTVITFRKQQRNSMAHIDPIIDKILIARVGLLLRHPFFGNLASRLKIQDGTEWVARVYLKRVMTI